MIKILKVNRLQKIFQNNPNTYFTKSELLNILNYNNKYNLDRELKKLKKLKWVIGNKEILYLYDNNQKRIKPFYRLAYKCNYFNDWSKLNYFYEIAKINGKIK